MPDRSPAGRRAVRQVVDVPTRVRAFAAALWPDAIPTVESWAAGHPEVRRVRADVEPGAFHDGIGVTISSGDRRGLVVLSGPFLRYTKSRAVVVYQLDRALTEMASDDRT